jgi:hypothetical protein
MLWNLEHRLERKGDKLRYQMSLEFGLQAFAIFLVPLHV